MMLMRIWIVLVAAVGVLLLLWVGWGSYVIMTTERPPYDVLRRLTSRVEIRQYDAQTWISTDYASDESSFRVLDRLQSARVHFILLKQRLRLRCIITGLVNAILAFLQHVKRSPGAFAQ